MKDDQVPRNGIQDLCISCPSFLKLKFSLDEVSEDHLIGVVDDVLVVEQVCPTFLTGKLLF